jgi:hypothetical protein
MQMTNVDIELVVRNIMAKGPSRVMVSKTKSTTCRVATTQFHIEPTIIFIRHDGWTLGANEKFEEAAYKTWPENWIAFLRKPNETAQPIAEHPFYGGGK